MTVIKIEELNTEINLYVEELNEQIDYLLSNDPEDEFLGDQLVEIAKTLKQLGIKKEQLLTKGEV